jgi:hypothetical protein
LVTDGTLNQGEGNALTAKVNSSEEPLDKGNVMATVNNLNALPNEIEAMRKSGRLTDEQADDLCACVLHMLEEIGGVTAKMGFSNRRHLLGKPPPGVQLEAFPNPFESSANITYTLQDSGSVRLAVYDLLGRRVDSPTSRAQLRSCHS